MRSSTFAGFTVKMNRMTRYLFALIAAALTCGIGTPSATGATLEEIKQRGSIIVATEDDAPPFDYAVNGGRAGYDHDLLVIFAQSTSLEIRQEILPWQEILPGVASGKYDAAVTAVVVTRERAKLVDFTLPVAESTMAYIKLRTDKSIGSLKDLAGKTIGVQRAGPSFDALSSVKAELRKSGGKLGKVVQYRAYAEAYEDLLKHRVDVVINNSDSLSQLVTGTSGLFELGQPFGQKSYIAWAVQKGNRTLLEFLNVFLVQQKAGGTFAQLQAKYKLSFVDLPNQPLLPGGRPIR
jgi:polar amino acid transport system substrate-binding protein